MVRVHSQSRSPPLWRPQCTSNMTTVGPSVICQAQNSYDEVVYLHEHAFVEQVCPRAQQHSRRLHLAVSRDGLAGLPQ